MKGVADIAFVNNIYNWTSYTYSSYLLCVVFNEAHALNLSHLKSENPAHLCMHQIINYQTYTLVGLNHTILLSSHAKDSQPHSSIKVTWHFWCSSLHHKSPSILLQLTLHFLAICSVHNWLHKDVVTLHNFNLSTSKRSVVSDKCDCTLSKKVLSSNFTIDNV